MTKEQLHLYPLTSSQREICLDQMRHPDKPYNFEDYIKIPSKIESA